MSLIVAGRFGTFVDAQKAAQLLFAHGFEEEDVTLFFVNPPGQHHRIISGGDRMADPDASLSFKGASMGVVVGATLGASAGAVLGSILKIPLFITLIAAGIGAYLGSLVGAMLRTLAPQSLTKPKIHISGVLLAVHVTSDNQHDAATA